MTEEELKILRKDEIDRDFAPALLASMKMTKEERQKAWEKIKPCLTWIEKTQ